MTASTGAESALKWEWTGKGDVRVGSEAHKELFCRMLLDTYDPYKPAVIPWPQLDGDALARLTSLPFWDIAVQTESETSMQMQLIADETEDPLIRKALTLNAFEERRHKEVLQNMIRFYGIEIAPEPDYPKPPHVRWSYMNTGYGECFDSFFAFGLFRVAQDSGFFPPELIEVFEPVIQEEARHILFFANWVAYMQAHMRVWQKPWFMGERMAALFLKAVNRLSFARSGDNNSNMTMRGHETLDVDLSPRSFLALCLTENNRRMARYDRRLLRPRFMPRLVRTVLPFLPRG